MGDKPHSVNMLPTETNVLHELQPMSLLKIEHLKKKYALRAKSEMDFLE